MAERVYRTNVQWSIFNDVKFLLLQTEFSWRCFLLRNVCQRQPDYRRQRSKISTAWSIREIRFVIMKYLFSLLVLSEFAPYNV